MVPLPSWTLMIVIAAISAALVPLTPGALRVVPIVAGLAAAAWSVALSVRDLGRDIAEHNREPAVFPDLSLDDALTMLRPPPPPRRRGA